MRRLLSIVAAAGWALSGAASAQTYNAVTDQRLSNPEPGNWLQFRGNYAGWGYSPLDEITPDNVSRLRPVWTYSTGVTEGHQAAPVVNDGMMFVSTPQNQILAFEAATGKELWRYVRALPDDLFQLHPTNRGVGLYGDKVYMATVDAYVVALDATTGEVVWETEIGDYTDGYYSTLSPLVADGKVVVGVSGGEFGIRGYITALDAETGAEAWKTYTVPEPGEPGSETWKGDAWKTGGGSIWMQGNYDPEGKIAYFGTGNGGPWMPDTRPGDNLYTTSVVAIDMQNGEIIGHHQYHWNDAWDWDEVSAPLLIDYEKDGQPVKGLVHAGRNGYLWEMARSPEGPIKFVSGQPFVRQNVFTGLDESGRPSYDPSKTPGTDKTVTFCPSLWGGKDWPPEAYSPDTGLFYIPSHENLCSELGGAPMEAREPGELWIGVPLDVILSSLRFHESVDTSQPVPIGKLQAWDLAKGELAWEHSFMDTAYWGPILTTKGGLVFTGGTQDRKFHAFDAETGDLVWEFPTNSGITGVPSSFEVDGKQYIAVQSGWGVDSERMRALLEDMLPEGRVPEVPQGGVVWVFALDDA
ncbi:PQQ-dependent dehydrogenase, methanol/ethanol family [Acuticoccus sp. I52.16.1]|uniref:PQQ-dependent dehydrogenase, methanol/ethanol family n=1 Tax=Acuticoccus sp. I52.16.1 TaxID=2928472 RepID=UPI001FD1A611|nr:PQQ-dependent dehydrogenase, methanol/ethanol family [Acuticoccus sp. I52.16.1]UOM35061.1 PQQ-dependent dehydrogenase, methanol/ethanol family [Acuticoccus sp. I52.16.1]